MAERRKVQLNVSPRPILGKKVKRLRRQGIIPANVYGRALESVAIQVAKDDLVRVIRAAGRNEIIYLRVDGEEPRPTFVRQIQRSPVTDAILHVDFYQISLKEKVRIEIPLALVGTAPAEQTYGGTLLHSLDSIAVEGLPTDIPSVIEVDVSGLKEIDAAIHVGGLSVPDQVTVLTDPEVVVAKVAAPHVERVEEEVAVEEKVAEVRAEEAAPEKAAVKPVAEAGKEGEG
jgi:large subunit ribosomal protein L25